MNDPPRPMLLDELMPEFDATRIEHRVIDGDRETVYRAVLDADFLRAWRENAAVRLLFAARGAAERTAARVCRRNRSEPQVPDSMRLADMPSHGEWVKLGEAPPHEVAFGAIGRFWAGETVWEEISAHEFRGFATPGFARLGCNFSLRSYGTRRTLVSYEARTQGIDDEARRAFLRYWSAVSIGVGIVMRSQLAVVARSNS